MPATAALVAPQSPAAPPDPLRPFLSGDRLDLLGPDLRHLPSLAEQLAMLDGVATDPSRYALAWLSIATDLGSAPYVIWHPTDAEDAVGEVSFGYACDAQAEQRYERVKALRDHIPSDPRFRAAIRIELISRCAFVDNRREARQ